MRPGKLIAFEGGDGSGKSTLIEKLAHQLRQEGWAVVAAEQPQGTELGQEIYALIKKHPKANPLTLASLFLAARTELYSKKVRPALKANKIVFLSRTGLSTIVYQGELGGLSDQQKQWLTYSEEVVTGGIKPDLLILIDCDAREVEKRLVRRGSHEAADRFDHASSETREKIRQAYLRRYNDSAWSHRSVIINSTSLTPEEVLGKVRKLLTPLLRQRRSLS